MAAGWRRGPGHWQAGCGPGGESAVQVGGVDEAKLLQGGCGQAGLVSLVADEDDAQVVISNGVINLCDDKAAVFREIARILKPGGRTAISDIVTELQLTEAIVCDASLWASCIGGAMQQDDYRRAIEDAGLTVRTVREIPPIPVHLRLGAGRDQDLRREKHLGASQQGRLGANDGPCRPTAPRPA